MQDIMRKIYIVLSVLALTLFTACAKFLDVNPKGELFDHDMFNSSEKFADALYGVYSEISGNKNLYAGNIFWAAEIMSGNVSAITDNTFGNMALGNWDNNGVMIFRRDVWESAYVAINHINNVIKHAYAADAGQIENLDIYTGEALAIRALVHFELLRLFGAPYWAAEEYKKNALPYVKTYSFDITSFYSLDEAYSFVIADLKEAEKFLAKDEAYVLPERDNVPGDFLSCRTIHLNLYAVQALLARVYWTIGDLDTAAVYADKVISSGKFSFRPQSAFVQPDNGTIDLNETIFGLYSSQGSNSFQNLNKGKYGFGSSSSYFQLADDWKSIYEGGSSTATDYRLGAWFDESERRLKKLVNPVFFEEGQPNYKGKSILGANILRLPEMYFIMAESKLKNEPSRALEYFNAVITTRGLEPVAQLTYDMLYLERRKEFYGEGFTWHEMKRKGMDIPTGTGSFLDGSQPANYMVPVPVDETESREHIN